MANRTTQRGTSFPSPVLELLSSLLSLSWASSEEFLTQAVGTIRDFTGAVRVSLFWGCREDRCELKFADGKPFMEGEIIPGPISRMTLKTGKPFITDDINNFPSLLTRWSGYYDSPSCAVLPLPTSGFHAGILCLAGLRNIDAWFAGELIKQWELILSLLSGHLTSLDMARNQSRPEAELGQFVEAAYQASSGPALIERLGQILAEAFDTRAVMAAFLGLGQPRLVLTTPQATSNLDIERMFSALHRAVAEEAGAEVTINLSHAQRIGPLIEAEEQGEELAVVVEPVFINQKPLGVIALLIPREGEIPSPFIHTFGLALAKIGLMEEVGEEEGKGTHLLSQYEFHRSAEREFARARRYGFDLSVIIVDLDHFREVNETYGYECGDHVLSQVGRIIAEHLRTTDLVSRFEGENFVLLLPHTRAEDAVRVADRIRNFIAYNTFRVGERGGFVKLTACCGVAGYRMHHPASLAELFQFAARAAEEAKGEGANLTRLYSYTQQASG